MPWDESLFKSLYNAARGAFGSRPGSADDRVARLADHQARLQLLACALSGERLVVQAAEQDGGWRGDAVTLPAAMAFAADPEANLAAYVLRVAYACTSRRLGFTLDAAAREDPARAVHTLLAVPATRAALLAELPGAADAEAAARAAALAARPDPPRGGAAAALEALARLRLGVAAEALVALLPAPALAWAVQADAARPATPAALRAIAPALLAALPGRGPRGTAAVPLWGWLLPAAPRRAARVPSSADESTAAALPLGSERHAAPRETVEYVEQPEDPRGENPLVHSFEKVHTLEQYTGGRKRIDASDEMAAHGDALDELDLRQVVRSSRGAASVYNADVLFADVAGEVSDAAAGGVPYDEWDEAGRRYRPAWCRVRPSLPRADAGAAELVAAVRRRHRRHIDDLRAVFERAEAARSWRLRQADGSDIDVDAVIDRYARLRAGNCASDKLYAARRRHSRDVAVLVLLDASLSTDGWVANRRVMDVEKESVIVLGEALAGLYDEVALAAFYSQTRRDCRFLALKGFREAWPAGYARLAAVEPRGYTRVGPALRHATELLLRTRARKRLLLLVSDGKPTDLDRYEGRYGIADIRQAVREAEAVTVETVALAVDHRARLYLPRMFGAGRFAILPSPAHLADAMARVCLERLR